MELLLNHLLEPHSYFSIRVTSHYILLECAFHLHHQHFKRTSNHPTNHIRIEEIALCEFSRENHELSKWVFRKHKTALFLILRPFRYISAYS